MRMTNRYGQRVGCIVRLGRRLEFQQGTNHLLYLWLFGTAKTSDRTFYLCGRVLKDRQLRFGNRCHADTADMSQFQGALHVLSVKNTFECGDIGLNL